MLDIDQLRGLWQRSLIVQPDGTRDTTTAVHWLQGPEHYIDLRQPAGRPSFEGVRALRDLTAPQVAFLARQEGFAGRLTKTGAFFEWHRDLDFQPPSSLADAGRLWLEDGIMKEEGRDIPYLEHWHRVPVAESPATALLLREMGSGVRSALVMVGSVFMYARDRAIALPHGARLADLVATAPDLDHAQNLIDCEISFGHMEAKDWMIQASSLPYREGHVLIVRMAGENHLAIDDVTPNGQAFSRNFTVVAAEGAALEQWLRPAQAAPAD